MLIAVVRSAKRKPTGNLRQQIGYLDIRPFLVINKLIRHYAVSQPYPTVSGRGGFQTRPPAVGAILVIALLRSCGSMAVPNHLVMTNRADILYDLQTVGLA
jgi:hypothetical protein